MATLPKELDTKTLVSGRFTLEVRLTRLNQWGWRLGLALWLCKLASKIAWLNFELVSESEQKPYLYYLQQGDQWPGTRVGRV